MTAVKPMTVEQAHAVFDVLVEHAGASEAMRDQFVHHMPDGCREFRFQGALGFGGKLYTAPRRWYVGCYTEDRTPERGRIIRETNAALNALHATYTARED